jgi:hypothetical protein
MTSGLKSRRRPWALILVTVVTAATIALPGMAAADDGPAFTSPPSTAFTAGAASIFTVTTSGDPPIAISDNGAALPDGVSFTDHGDGTATMQGTPAVGSGGTYPLTLTASNGTDPDATQSFTLTVDEPPGISSADTATFTAGGAGSFTVTTTGNPVPALSESGTLPTGLTFTDDHNGTATVGGIPGSTAGGSYPITVTASNGITPDAQQTLTVVVLAQPVLSLMVPPFTASGPVTYDVKGGGQLGVTTGSVSVSDGQGGTCTAALSDGQGACTIADEPGSSPFTITARYGGDSHYAPTQTSASVASAVAAAGSATAETGQISATAQNGQDGVDTLTAVSYSTDPVVPASGGGPFFAVAVSPDTQFSSLLITDCAPTSGSTLLEWWNPTAATWEPVAGDPGPQQSKTTHCLTVALDANTSSPSLAQLAGSAFTTETYSGAVKAPTFTSKTSVTCRVAKACRFVVKTKGTPKPSVSVSGPLPPGLSLADKGEGRALLAGTPSTGSQGRYPLTLTAATGAGTVREPFVVNVNSP